MEILEIGNFGLHIKRGNVFKFLLRVQGGEIRLLGDMLRNIVYQLTGRIL